MQLRLPCRAHALAALPNKVNRSSQYFPARGARALIMFKMPPATLILVVANLPPNNLKLNTE
eukprot:4807720-Pyramimonas_sp.AAC.1